MTKKILGEIAAVSEGLSLPHRKLILDLCRELENQASQTPTQNSHGRKSKPRLRIEKVHGGPVGGSTNFIFGTFANPKALDMLCRTVGGAGWYEVKVRGAGQLVTKVR